MWPLWHPGAPLEIDRVEQRCWKAPIEGISGEVEVLHVLDATEDCMYLGSTRLVTLDTVAAAKDVLRPRAHARGRR